MIKYLTQKLTPFRQSAELQKLEKFFFALFLFSIPAQTRLTFYTPQTYSNGTFNEYATFFLYLSDIFLIITFLLYFVNLLTKYNIYGINKKLFHSSPHVIPIFFISITLITWSFIGIVWSEHKSISFYGAIKLAEFLLLFLYTIQRSVWFGINRVFIIIFISGLFESLTGIGQYVLQRSLGLKILMESSISPELPNVAKIVVDGERIIRAYGTFPHPNVFAGFLILSIFCGIFLLFCIKEDKEYKIVSRETILYSLFLFGIITQLFAFVLTFSRTAWMASVTVFLIILAVSVKLKLFHVKQFWNNPLNKTKKYALVAVISSSILIVAMFWGQINSRAIDMGSKYQQSVNYRILYNNIAIKIIGQKPLTGIGNGNFTLEMKKYSPFPLEWWQFQPAHNIYLLIASELGIIGLILFLLLVCEMLRTSWSESISIIASRLPNGQADMSPKAIVHKKEAYIKQNNQIVSRETILSYAKDPEITLLKVSCVAIPVGFLFIGLFDHYFWTLQQGQLTFWVTMGIMLGLGKRID